VEILAILLVLVFSFITLALITSAIRKRSYAKHRKVMEKVYKEWKSSAR